MSTALPLMQPQFDRLACTWERNKQAKGERFVMLAPAIFSEVKPCTPEGDWLLVFLMIVMKRPGIGNPPTLRELLIP